MNWINKIFDFILYSVLAVIGLGATILFVVFLYTAITHPEIIRENNLKHQRQMEGLLISDGCIEPVVEKGFFDCPKNETSYTFKCTKNQKQLSGVLCESGSSAYIRYDLNNFSN